MNRRVNYITNRLSLRPPQEESLQILAKLYDTLQPKLNKRTVDLEEQLLKVQEHYPTCTDFERNFPSLCFALATGVGKTRLMGASITYLFLEHGIRNFFVLAPNLTIYNKLLEDFANPQHPKYVFRGIAEFAQNPPRIINGDNYSQASGQELFDGIRINIFNISKINSETRGGREPRIKRMSEYLGDSYFNYLTGLDDLVILMDESHHYRADRGMTVINELDPILGLEFTATPQTQSGTTYRKFKNVVYEYSLAKAIADGFVKKPAVATRKDFNPDQYSIAELDRLKLLDGIRLHENTKAELAIYARDQGVAEVKPFMLVVATDTTHAAQLKEVIQHHDFFGGYYRDKVMDIHSSQTSSEKDENIERLLGLESPENPIEIVIHVNMLKEGWDVTNLYTIVPLRTSASKTLTEQTLGRGLRLPYGKHTGDDAVDTLTIVQHDKFQAIVDEASKPDSIVRIENIIQLDPTDDYIRKEVVTSHTRFDMDLIIRRGQLESLDEPTRKKEELNIRADEFILPFIDKIAPRVTSFTAEAITADEHINEFKRAYTRQLELEGNLFASEIAEEATARYMTTARNFVENTIPIPRLSIVPSGETRLVFDDFELDTSGMNFQPGSEDLLTHELQSGKQRIVVAGRLDGMPAYMENHIISALTDKQEICYDDHSELLYKLSHAAIGHFRSYLSNDREVLNVVMTHKYQIADLIYQQMMMPGHHHFEGEGFERPVMTVRPYTEIRDFSVSKNQGDRLYDYKEHIEPISAIRQKVFSGFTKAFHQAYKFDSKTEKDFAFILESDAQCIKWLKPALSQFNIYYGRPSRQYTPDFIVETPEFIAMVETKKRDSIDDAEVQAKAEAALTYCRHATEYNRQISGKLWKYVLIPHDQVRVNMSLERLLREWGVE